MLFIIYGATLEWGSRCREYLSSKCGFNIIKKYNYVDINSVYSVDEYKTPEGVFARWYDDKVYVSKDEFDACDFQYALNGVHVGFNQQQIFEAVRGVNNAAITLAASSLDFVRRIKMAYGDYVTVIFLSEGKQAYFENYKDAGKDALWVETRVNAAAEIQRIYTENYDVFDYYIPYESEASSFNTQFVFRALELIIAKRQEIEKKLNNKNYIALPYQGKEPYIFISYSHEDKKDVHSVLSYLQTNGYRIWYDDGIPGGANWRRVIAQKISESCQVICFYSKNARESRHVDAELSAIEECNMERQKNDQISLVTVRIDDCPMKLEHAMYLKQTQIPSTSQIDFRERLVCALDERTKAQ